MSDTYDVIVVGAGPSGLAASVSAAEAGYSVLLLDRAADPGGTANLAVGSVTLPSGPDDTADDFDSDTAHFIAGHTLSERARQLRNLFIEEAGDTLEWLRRHGVAFAGPFHEPPHRRPRLHVLVPDGRALGWALTTAATKLGVRIQCGRAVSSLVTEATGRVVGVSDHPVRNPERTRTVRSRLGVVVAAGDFSANVNLRRGHLGEAVADAVAVNPNNQGEGLAWMVELGAATDQMSNSFAPQLRFPPASSPSFAADGVDGLVAIGTSVMHRARLAPDLSLIRAGAILVDRHGRILERETAAKEAAKHGPATMILDSRWLPGGPHAEMRVSSAPSFGFATLSEFMAGRPDLCQEVENQDEVLALTRCEPPYLHVLAAELAKMSPPFILLVGAIAVVTVVEGSVVVDTHHRVLRDDGIPIDGLYAVGSGGQGGLLLWGHGLHLAWALTSGRLLGRSLAKARSPQ